MSKNAKKDPFPQTRELIRIALNQGKTQSEIARLCRTQQGQVSKWLNGKALADRAQVKPLLEEYGDLLFRVPFKLYQTEAASEAPRKYVRVEGKLILREKFRGKSQDQTSKTLRVSIHRQGSDQFALVIETTTAPYPDRNKVTGPTPLITDRLAAWFLDSSYGQDIWIANLDRVRHIAQCLGGGAYAKEFPSLGQLAYLATEALLNQGYKLNDLVEFKLAE